MSKKVLVTVAKDGTTTVKAEGYEGSSCMKATEAFEELLGANSTDKKTPEFYKTEGVKERESE